MNLEKIQMYEYVCIPIDKNKIDNIINMTVIIYAKDRTAADLIFKRKAHVFFDQDINRIVTVKYKGFREVK